MLQAQSQLKALYKDNMDTIIGNCDSSLFLGGKEETTLKSWSALLGKETIDMYNTSVTKGTQESHGQNFQKLGKDLMSMDELAVMDGGMCLLQVRGVRPFLSKKYDITQHPNYKYLSDFNPKNTFDMAEHIERTALPAASVTVQFEGQSEPMEFRYAYYHEHKLSLHAQFGKAEKFRLEPAVPGLLRGILASEQEYRHNFIPGVFENHLDQMIAAEKRSVTHFLKEAAANAPRPAPNKKTKEQPQR